MKEDYFDPDLAPDASLLPTDNTTATEELEPSAPHVSDEKPKKRQFFGYDLSTLLVAGAALIALTVYAIWPDSPPSRTFVPDEGAQQVARPVVPASTSEPVSSAAPIPMTTPESPALVVTDSEEMKQYSAANREAITVLNGRTGNVEQRLAALEAQLHALAAKPVAQPPIPTTAGKVTPVKKVSHTPSKVSKPTRVTGWRVNTVYPGMAWITHNGSTWSVQAGDVLQGMTIRSIDTQRRIVVTDKGVIRQGG
ncbi:TPA: hypothetical protein ACKP1J_004972 [Serratia liquefaciens]